ncbi:transcription factor TFIIIB component B'' homolog isoform X1 [Pangasianodon hypophthalmus]|uniref:transcription factor TFIIIB component B'' homolog isoform X1 n=2 Tax=Pangasianodon hypophthalmus TaxID=310915 RepID=UPI002307A60E|nr:transcription factor TFIIIB component B'' homolog isoform X1 [Pangasianodon hypophthalmus]
MMRRSRISVKPNFRPGSRTGTESEQVSQGVSEAGDTLPAVEVEVPRPAPSHQQNVALIEPSEDVAIKNAPEMPSKMTQNDGAPSSGATSSSAAPHRRMRISATPKLLGPKPTSTPRAQPSARMPSSAPSPLSNEEHVQIHDSASEAPAPVSIMSNDPSKSGAPRKSTSPTNLPTQSSTTTQSSSPCVPSTSGLRKSPVREKKSVEDSPPSPQPGQVPQQPPQEPEPPESPSSSDLSSVCFKPSQFDKAGSLEMVEKSSDKDRILRALKLKELMKIERRKDIQMGKRRVGHKEYTALDRSKMTMRDLIYYLPNTSPMRSSIAHEENQEETIIPPSPKQQIKTAEGDEEEEQEESENEEMLVPKVRVAEDGSIILDEESLTVRVQRTSNTKALEDSTALFERGSTTTYSSFRTLNYVKSWSVRETDLFFLAISMVGTDFSLIGQLLTHRSRAAIKSKFKKEERLNPWRVDKALRNKRPYDKEFFSYLLEKILAKDKDKRKSVKLILPKTKKPRKSKGKTSNKLCVSDDEGDDDIFHMDDHEDLEDDEDVSVEKENEDVSNVKEADTSVPAKKRRKRTRDVSKDKDKDNSTEEPVKRKRQRKCSKKTTKEVHSKDDTEGEHDINVEGDTINVNKEDELERSTSASKRRRKRSKNDEEKQNGKPVKGTKGKQLKKSRKVVCDHEESVSEHEESSIRDEDGSATKKKRKRAKNSDLDVDEPAKGKKNTKRKKALKSTVEEEGTAEEGEASAALQEAEQLNAPVTAEVADNVPPKATRRNKKPLPNLATTRSKKSNEPEASAEVERESQDENIHESILTAADSPSEDEKLQMQAVVVLEKTPPRQQNVLSPSKVQCKNNELEPSMSSPASPSSSESSSTQQTRMQRAGRAKRDLSTSGKTGRKTGMMDQDQADPESPMVLLEQNQEPEGEEGDNSLNENLINLSCLRDLDSQMFQRRPMMVLSREEVDMILDASDQSADEDPSVSPLDLSLNTELSFPLQCSKLLEDNDEEGEVDCVFEEHEERTNERASCEERNCEELELTESALAQPDIPNLRDSSTSLTPEVCSQPEVGLSKVTTPTEEAEPQVHPMACKDVTTVATVLEGSPPLVVLDNVEPICMKPDAPMTQETITTETTALGTSLVVSDIMDESEKAMLPTLLKESALASSEITAQSKLTPAGSGLGSHRSLQAAPEVKGELQKSLSGPSQTLETLQDSSEIEEGTQESALASSEIKARTQGCAVAPEVKEDSQEEVSVQSRPTRRSRFQKPKPNLSQKSRVLQNQGQDLKTPSTLKPKSSEPTVSTEKLLYSPATDQHGALEDFSKQNLTKEEETSQSNTVDQMESESTKDLSDASTAVPDQENITTVTLSPASADEPQAQPGTSNLRDISTSLTPEVCSQPEVGLSKVTTPTEEAEPQVHPMACKDVTTVATVLEGSPPLVVLDNVEPICMKPDAPMTQETITTETTTLGTSLVVSDIMEESEKAMLPTLLKESALASSEITAQSKLTPAGSGLGSHRSLQAAPEVKGEFQKSLSGPSQTLETLQDSSEIEEGTQESALASSEIKVRTQGCAVAPEVKEDSQEEVSVQSRPTRRSRFQKPKPNLSQKSRVLQNQGQDLKTPSTLKPKSSEPTVSTEKLLYSPATDQHGALEDFSKQNLTKEEETSQSNTVDRMEAESTKDLSDASTAVPDQENITAVTLSPASADEPQVASECSSSRCDVDMVPPCTSLTSQTGEDTGTGQMIVPSEDVCAPAEIVHLTEGGDKEPTFILTLYEIPVTQTYLPSSSNDSVMTSDLPTFETQASLGFSDQAHTLPSTSESSRIDALLMESDLGVVTKDLAENVMEQISAHEISAHETSHEITSPHTKDEDSDASANLEIDIPPRDPHSECKKSSEFAPLDDLAPRTSGYGISKCITALPQDSEDTAQCERVSRMVLADVFVPVSEDTGDDSSKDRTMAVETKEASSVSVTEDLAENVKEQTSSHEHILLDTKDEESDASANLEKGVPHMDHDTECKKGSEFAPLQDLASGTQSTPSGFNISKCIETLPQDSEGTEQCESVSHMVLGDIFVPVSENMGDDSGEDRTMAVESKLQSKEASAVSVTEDLAENVKEQISEHMTSHEPILLDTKDEESDACVNLETGIPYLDPDSECKKGSEISPVEDLASRNQSTPSGFNISKCIETLPQDSEDTEQCESVSHMVLGDIFVPVSEETGDNSSKDTAMAVECKLQSKEASSVGLPERQDTPYEELTKVENSPAVSNPLLCFDSTEESKDTPPLSEEKKAPARRRERQIKTQPKLVKRARAKDVSSKPDQLVKDPSQPTSSHVVLPASHEENLAGMSNTTDEKSLDRMSSRGNQTSVSRGKEVKPKSIAEESPKMSQSDSEPTESKPVSAALHLSKEPKLEEENSENVTGDATIKDDMESSAEDKELSILTSNEGENVRPSCEDMNFSLMKTSGSGSSNVGSEETEAEPQGVSHMVLPDVFVLVSDEIEDALCNDFTVSIESSPQSLSLPKKSGTHIQKELKTEAVSQTLSEESTQNQSPLVDIKTPVRKRGKQEVKRTCTKNDVTGTRLSQPTSPQATTPSSQLTTLPRNENMVLLEEKLQRRHHIMPCTVRLSSLDTVAQSLRIPQLGNRKGNDVMSSPTCHASVTNVSEESSTPSLFEGMKLEDPELEKKSPTRRKGKKNESSPDTKRGHLKPVQTISQTRQLTITDWAKKKSHQTATNQEEEEPEKSSQMQSSLKAKEMHLMVEKTCSKSQHTDSEEPEGSHLVPALEETEDVSSVSKEVNRSSEVAKESNEDPSVSQVKKSPARRRAKLQVKPILSKKACTKSEGNTSTTDQPQPTGFTSPTRQHAQAAREKKESDNITKLPIKEVTSTSSMEANSKSTESSSISSGPQSPISQDTWPRVVLPRVKLWTTEAGVCSASSTPTSSPARVSESVSPPVTPPQLKNSPTQSSSPTASENPDDDPSRVSQFFLCDIFTEVEEAE